MYVNVTRACDAAVVLMIRAMNCSYIAIGVFMKYVNETYDKRSWSIVQFESFEELKSNVNEVVIVKFVNETITKKYQTKATLCQTAEKLDTNVVDADIFNEAFADEATKKLIREAREAREAEAREAEAREALSNEIQMMIVCKVPIKNIAKIKNLPIDDVKSIIAEAKSKARQLKARKAEAEAAADAADDASK